MENKENIGTPLKTRSSNSAFDWKTQCFICGEKCDPKRDKNNTCKGYYRSWSFVENTTSTDTAGIYSKVLEAAKKRQDHAVLDRLFSLPNGDLVASEARYHRKKGCLTKYYDTSRVEYPCTSNTYKSIHRGAAEKLKKEYEHSIMTQKRVYHLSTLRKRFIEIAKVAGRPDAENYKSANLKKLLSDIWPELSFVPQQGKSDLVCSSSKTLGETLQEAKQLQLIIDQADECAYDLPEEDETDESVVHKAIGILRRKVMSHTKRLDNEYYSPEEVDLSTQKSFVEPLLYKAVCWLSDIKLFKTASETTNKKYLSVACDLTTLVTTIPSPKHLGLAIHIYNDFGSRHLVDDMFNLGYSISYPELRMFLSSAANHAIKSQQKTSSGGIVPDIIPKEQDGKLIVAVADNWDHNERTVDGKRTTHAMTSIFVCNKSIDDMPMPRLQRAPNRTFDSTGLPGGGLCNIVPYAKPSCRACPFFDPAVTLDEIKPMAPQEAKLAQLKELLYAFGRSYVFCDDVSEESGNFPPWNVFHSNSCRQDKPEKTSNIVYNPIIMANPTDYSTVYTTLLRTKEVFNALGQTYVPIVFDMGLLAKALQIVWSKSDELKGVIPIEGGMHLLMSVFAGIGYIYGQAGLGQLLTDSGLYAPATVVNILAGKDFDRATTAFKLIDEALNIRLLINFENWCEENNKEIHPSIYSMLSQLREMGSDPPTESCLEEFCDVISNHIIPLMKEFKQECRQISPTFRVWDDYLTNVSTPLKLFISSTRSPNWTIQQYAKLQLMPLLFASNRTTYAKYMTVQLLQMNRLPKEIKDGFAEGYFTAKLSESSFSNVWMDYTLEVTQNKALKGSGGIIGLTLRENALARWFLARPLSSRYSSTFHKSISTTNGNEYGQTHHSDTRAQREQYNKSVSKLISMFDGNFIDPFNVNSTPNSLINFASGVHTSDEVERSMTECFKTGMTLFETFVSERLVQKTDGSDPPTKNFYSPLPRTNLKTMSGSRQKVTGKVKAKATISGEVMFQRLLAINTYKKVSLERVFSFENTMVPLSMFSENGNMHKVKKSDFLSKLEDLLPCRSSDIQGNADVIIFDGMAVIHILPVHNQHNTFKDMASTFLKYILMKARSIPQVKNVHIVFDKYSENSLKCETRKARGDITTSNSVYVHNSLRLPKDWKMFLSNGKNKENLSKFYSAYMRENAHSELKVDEILIINGVKDEACTQISSDSCTFIPDLKSNHEEADTLMILHAKYAAQMGCTSLVVQSPDTDVLVLLIHHYSNIGVKYLNMITGTVTSHTDRRRFIPVHTLIHKLSQEQMKIILTAYCLTGCDTTCGFYGKGKKKVFNQLMKFADKYEGLHDVGEMLCFTKLQKMTCMKFIVNLYGGEDTKSLNEVRCTRALQCAHPRSLPPTEDSFFIHCLRCVLQLWIWRHATTPMHDMPQLTSFGFENEVGCSDIKPKFMNQAVAAPELLNDMICECTSCSEKCACFLNEQPCTTACNCTANLHSDDMMCTNVYTLSAIYSLDLDYTEHEDE